jgi:hypothetical protein
LLVGGSFLEELRYVDNLDFKLMPLLAFLLSRTGRREREEQSEVVDRHGVRGDIDVIGQRTRQKRAKHAPGRRPA